MDQSKDYTARSDALTELLQNGRGSYDDAHSAFVSCMNVEGRSCDYNVDGNANFSFGSVFDQGESARCRYSAIGPEGYLDEYLTGVATNGQSEGFNSHQSLCPLSAAEPRGVSFQPPPSLEDSIRELSDKSTSLLMA